LLDAQDGHDLCIFHLSCEQKDADEFWCHFASYLRALYAAAGNDETAKFIAGLSQEHWLFRAPREDLVSAYMLHMGRAQPWCFAGFVFPASDRFSFEGVVFGAVDFRSVRFCANPSLAGTTPDVHGEIGESECRGRADMSLARFSGDANFEGAKFCGMASMRLTEFSAAANFASAEFCDSAVFFRARFRGRADFTITTYEGSAIFHGACFYAAASFDYAGFHGGADFARTDFREPPSFSGADFRTNVDFTDAKLPGFSGSSDERIARSIRVMAEKRRDYEEAGRFYRFEMDLRRRRCRRAPTHWLQYAMLELYRITSCYGESPGRVLVSLSVALLLFSYAFVISGFWFTGRYVHRDLWAPPADLLSALGLALANLLPGNLPVSTPQFAQTRVANVNWAVAQVIVTYVLLTMLVIAVRRRFRR
jgi:uncharacterized protein YjbI with pentapeptide repeats